MSGLGGFIVTPSCALAPASGAAVPSRSANPQACTRNAPINRTARETRIALLRQHGSFPQAYSATFQPGLEHFGDERGFLAYKMVWGTAMVLADPVASHADARDLIARFLHLHPDVTFWQVSPPVAEILASLGFFINKLGTETRLDLAGYDFGGQGKRNLRKAAVRAAKRRYMTRECPLASVDLNEVKAVSEAWKRTRPLRRRETAFLSRPIVFGEELDVRRFFTFDRDGKLVAFAFFDPVYENGGIVGYLIATTRSLPNADLVLHAVKRCAIETFQREGKKWVFHGLSPFEGIKDKDFAAYENRLVRRAFRFAYTNPLFNRYVYSLQGLAQNKRQLGGVTEQTYYAFNKLPSLPRVLKLIRACNIF